MLERLFQKHEWIHIVFLSINCLLSDLQQDQVKLISYAVFMVCLFTYYWCRPNKIVQELILAAYSLVRMFQIENNVIKLLSFHIFQATIKQPGLRILQSIGIISLYIYPEPNFNTLFYGFFILQFICSDVLLILRDWKKQVITIEKPQLLDINAAVVIFDKNYNRRYKNTAYSTIEQEEEEIPISTNRTHDQTRQQLIQEQSVKDKILDETKFRVYRSNFMQLRKYIGLKKVIQDVSEMSEFNCIAKISKEKYHVTINPINIEDEDMHLITFYPISFVLNMTQFNEEQKFRTNLISSFNHKLKTPLNTVLSNLESLIRENQLPKEVLRKYIKPAIINSKLELYLIQDILDYVQINCNVSVKNVNLIKLIEEIYLLINTQCMQKQINFIITFNQQTREYLKDKQILCYILTDENKLLRSLLNLLNNAYRFTPREGTIKLEIQEFLKDEQRFISFKISDTGVGLSNEIKDEIRRFIRYQQSLPLQTRKSSNQIVPEKSNKYIKVDKVGVSLRITTKLLGYLNAQESFRLESIEGEGTIFQFTISDVDAYSSGYNISSARRMRNSSPRFNEDIYQYFDELEQDIQEPEAKKVLHQTCQKQNQLLTSPSPIFKLPPALGKSSSFKAYPVKQPKQSPTSVRNSIRNSRGNLSLFFEDRLNHIVIIDDEPFNHITLERMLKQIGYQNVSHCYNGQEMVELVLKRQFKIKAALMDIDMPVMDGIQCTKVLMDLMQKDQISCFPIIACTAHEDEETKDQCIEAGMCSIVFKPVLSSVLQEALNDQ